MSESPADLIRAEIKRMADAEADRLGYDKDSDSYEYVKQDQKYEMRGCYDQEADGIDAWEYSRNYECTPVVKRLAGHWVCWLFWYGGGKHGEPESMEWIDDAIFVEEGEPIIVKTFKKLEKAHE